MTNTRAKSEMAFPRELEEETICRLPPRSLVRFRSVCKHWNSVFHDKSFLNKHLSLSRPQFIVLTDSSMIYSIDMVDLDLGTVDKCELPCDFPCEPPRKFIHTNIASCEGLLFRYFWSQGFAIWNPWLREKVGWIPYKEKDFFFCGVGYDSSRRYKFLGYLNSLRRVRATLEENYYRVAVYECASQTVKFLDAPFEQWWPIMDALSLNGNLYWVTHKHRSEYFIQSFDFSTEMFQRFCNLPCHNTYFSSQVFLSVFEGDRFSLLKQCYDTGKIQIWVTKTKIIHTEQQQVEWIHLITFPTTNLPKLVNMTISYLIFDKTLIVCCDHRQTLAPCIYIVRGEDVFKEIPIHPGTRFSHCIYFPNFISLPSQLQV